MEHIDLLVTGVEAPMRNHSVRIIRAFAVIGSREALFQL